MAGRICCLQSKEVFWEEQAMLSFGLNVSGIKNSIFFVFTSIKNFICNVI
jgi:hypothetical protein